ncbi:CidA/LrgA family protein [Marinobacteraceae bacterium S3BR75-40.1]
MHGLLLILIFQLTGAWLVDTTQAPVPGAIVGLILFFAYLVATRGGRPPERRTGQYLISHLPLLFVPAGVGVMTYGDLLQAQALPIGLALILGTLIAFVVTALLMQHFIGKTPQRNEDGDHGTD